MVTSGEQKWVQGRRLLSSFNFTVLVLFENSFRSYACITSWMQTACKIIISQHVMVTVSLGLSKPFWFVVGRVCCGKGKWGAGAQRMRVSLGGAGANSEESCQNGLGQTVPRAISQYLSFQRCQVLLLDQALSLELLSSPAALGN